MIVSREEFPSLTRPLIGLKVARASQGYGSAILVDLGRLIPEIGGRRSLRAEAALILEWDWRFETESGIVCGSSSSNPAIADGLAELEGRSVVAVRVEGRLPELVAELDGGLWIRSCACVEGDPQWSLRLPGGSWLHCEAGAIHRLRKGEAEAGEPVEEEDDGLALAEAAAKRWGEKLVPEARGFCADCACYIRLDGPGHLLDYGVCGSPRSIFDGRVVSFRSGCAAFVDRRS
jgi:hypothetical protein